MAVIPRRKKYLNNADILREIHKSKMSYCWLLDEAYSMYDYIVFDESSITEELIEKAHSLRVKRLNNSIIESLKIKHNCGQKRAKEIATQNNLLIDNVNNVVELDEVVIRVITDDHIPDDEIKKDQKVRVNFEPFKQYIVDNSGELCEVARSHWSGEPDTGEFSLTSGRITNELGKMFIKLAEQISHKANYRNYTYIDEMQADARDQLVRNALLFKESKLYCPIKPVVQLNPFSYYTSFVNNAFKSVLNAEKRVRNIRDDLLELNGYTPSHTRQVEIEMKMIEDRKASNGIV